MKKWKVWWPFFPFLIFALLGVLGWFILPDTLVIRGEGAYPKLMGLLVPVALGAFGGSLAAREKTRWAGWIVVVIAAVTELMLFAWNI